MGIYNDVSVEIRNRLNITDLYIRPMNEGAEIWVEIENADYKNKYISIDTFLVVSN